MNDFRVEVWNRLYVLEDISNPDIDSPPHFCAAVSEFFGFFCALFVC